MAAPKWNAHIYGKCSPLPIANPNAAGTYAIQFILVQISVLATTVCPILYIVWILF